MSFNSVHFLIFFPIVTIIYFLIPSKIRYIWLLVASYYFYISWSPKYAILIAFSTFVTYLSGLLIERCDQLTNKIKCAQLKKLYLFSSFLINLGILFVFKYYNFFTKGFNFISNKIGMPLDIPYINLLLPVGISFYTFQALSYTVDVYRNDIKAEKNFCKYALFVSFFPQLVAGPIEKSKDLLDQFNYSYKFDYVRVKDGLIQMMWGFFKKIFIADRVSTLVNTVYNAPQDYAGFQIMLATVFFAVQIYCDFSAYSDIAIGCAKVLGYKLTRNFNQPYFAKSIKDFWRRWHITLSSWFRDYLYIPLGGSRKGKIRTYINLMIVFLFSGLWHGASINFVIWGALHGGYQVIGNALIPVRDKLHKLLHINNDTFGHKIFKIIITFILVNFAWIFFRANSFSDAKILVQNLFVFNPWCLTPSQLSNLGLGSAELLMSIFGIFIMIIIDSLSSRINVIEKLSEQNLFFRWGVYVTTLTLILIFGVYGSGYSESQFIYFQF